MLAASRAAMGGWMVSTVRVTVLALACTLACVVGREVDHGGGRTKSQTNVGMKVLQQVVEERPVGAVDAPCGRFPYMASLQTVSGEHICGGVLIDKQWVLTAAQCVVNTSQLYPTHVIALGLCNITDAKGTEDSGRIVEFFTSERIEVHPMYTGQVEDGNDIALVKLNNESKNVPVSVANNTVQLLNQNKLSLLGFGISGGGVPADTLQFTNEMIAIENILCKGVWQDVIQDSMVCAFGFAGVDSCPGDAGGPLLLTFEPGGDIEKGLPDLDYVVGIVSFGENTACGESGVPSVYTRVASFAEWIEDIIA